MLIWGENTRDSDDLDDVLLLLKAVAIFAVTIGVAAYMGSR